MFTSQDIVDVNYDDLPIARNFDHDLNILMADILPGMLAPKGHHGRSVLATAFQSYFEHYSLEHTESSAMIKARYQANIKHGVNFEDQGRLEVGTLLGILANTIPSTFYMLCRIYADAALLENIRNELEASCLSTMPNGRSRTLNVLTMREESHLLHATFQEVLRVHAMGAGARYVREDVMLNNKYLLKKGMIVQMPMAVMHSDAHIWGTDVEDFQPRRFMKQSDAQKDANKESKSKAVAYRPFGGGSSLCPGRHFVTLEVMALTALMVLRFDIEPANGAWRIPAQRQESLATNVWPPAQDLSVKVKVREGFSDVDWQFTMN